MGDPQYMRFPVEEYKMRFDKAREWMGKNNLDGLFITEGQNYTYFSGGGRDTAMARPHTLLLPRKGDPVAIIQRFPAKDRKKQFWFDDIRVYNTMLGLPFEMIIEAMKDVGMAEGRVGAEIGYEQRMGCSMQDFLKLKEILPKAEFMDAADIFWGLRMVKSPEEIKRNRRACQITSQAYDALFPGLYAGMSEKEIVDRFLKLQVEIGGLIPWALISSSLENYDGGGGGPGAHIIEKGDQVWMDGGCQYSEYGSDFCCTGTVGPPSDKQQKMQRMVLEITRTVVGAIRPGIRTCDLDALNSAEWEKRGYDYSKINWGGGRIGHGLGWGRCLTEPPHIASYDETVIRPGMIITIEPGINIEYGTYCIEMNIAVTEDGHEVLNDFDRELRTISA